MLVWEVDATWHSMQEGAGLQHMHSSSPLLPAISPPLRPAHLQHRDSSRPLATRERSRSQNLMTGLDTCGGVQQDSCSLDMQPGSAVSAQAGRTGQLLLCPWGDKS